MSSTTDNEQRFAYLLSPEFQNVNTAGKPLTGGWIEVYIHGTRVKYYCFSDFDGTLHPFQIPLDSLGSNIVLASPTQAYDIYIYNKFGALVMSRYNIVPACNAADIVEDVVVIDSPDETLNVTCDGESNWHLTVNTDLIVTTEQLASVSGDLQDQIDNKKDLQLPYVASGTVTKTITKIEQNENGEIEVTYEDIDLPPQVPNIDIISPSGTIDVSSSVNPATNTKTFKIDIYKTKMDFFDGYCGKSHYEDRSSSSTSAFGLYVDQWDEYKYQGDFIVNSWQDENNTTFKLNSGLYLITASIRYQMNSDYNKEEYIRIATGAYNGLENGTRYKDWSYEKELGDGTAESSIQVSFIRNVEDDDDYTYMNGNHDLYFYPYLPVGVNYAFIDHLQIVKLDSIAGSGPRYAAGYGIEILDDVIQVATGTVVTNNYFNTVVSSINNEINTTIQNVTGDITELSEAVTNIIGATGDYATEEYVDEAIAAVTGQPFEQVNSDWLATSGKAEILNKPDVFQLIAGDGVELTDSTLPSGIKAKTIDVKVGNGLEIDSNNVIKLDSEVSDVVETVEKLKKDLDTQITTNFDMPNISQVYDFADPSVSTLANGACMLCQSFTIPINHELRTTTDDADTPTLLGIYAQQNFAHKIMLALYEYTYAAEGEEHGSSTYVGDTGPVNVVQGVNEYPLKNRNPSITELRSDKVYYATLYLPNAARVNGLFLAGAPNYGNASIPAEPRLTCGVDNITWDGRELDMSDPTTTLNHYQEVIIPGQPTYYQYFIGPWQSGYNERQTAPRFYMQIRNGEFNVPVIPTAPFNDLGDVLPHGTADQSNIPSFSPSQVNSAFRDVTPLLNVTITSFEWIDGMQNAAGWAAANCVYDSGFANNLSGVSNSVVDLGQVVTGSNPGYAHRITFTTPITLTAGTTYRFLCGCTNGSPYFKVWLDPTDVIHVGNNGWYVIDTNVLRIDHQMGMYNKLYDNQNNHYVI